MQSVIVPFASIWRPILRARARATASCFTVRWVHTLHVLKQAGSLADYFCCTHCTLHSELFFFFFIAYCFTCYFFFNSSLFAVYTAQQVLQGWVLSGKTLKGLEKNITSKKKKITIIESLILLNVCVYYIVRWICIFNLIAWKADMAILGV